ncbi:hypothetical protein ACH5RR_036279 [Cinchona calisaya]|uniref:Late blight resistance protein homolog R1A-3 n=1 Tax=Cinchona calisaya TaxID=153742 RepID=A0ABD2Y4Q0_9GENT
MVWTCVDSALEELAWLESDSRKKFPIANQIQASQLELRFLKMFFGCLAKWEDVSLGSEMVSIESALKEAGQGLYAAGLIAIHKRKVTDWNILTKNLMEKVEEFKPLIGEKCIVFLGCSMQCKTSTSDEILEFLDSIFKNLEDLVNSKVSVVTCLQRQIGSIQEKIKLFRNFADFISKRCIEHEKLEHLLDHIQIWANYVSCLSILYWINEMDEILERRMHVLLSDVMQKIKPCTLQVTGLYIEALKASKSPRSDTFLMGKVVGRFVDFLLENLVITLRDRVEIFREGLIFLITFLMDPPEENAEDEELIFTQVDALTSRAASVICSLQVDDLKEGLSLERSIVLSDFLEEINKVKADVGMHHVQVLNSLQSNFPWTNATGFVDSLLENVKKMLQVKANFIPFPKHRVETVHGELESVRSSLTDIMELQNEHEELKDLWTRVINVVYHAEHVIDSCLIADNPIWYNILCLSKVIEEIKLARRDVQKIGDEQMYNMQNLNARAKFSHAHPSQPNTSSIDEVIVGFKDEAETIIDRLTRGSKQLDIVSIAGMPGLGKTTLAKKIYNDPSVQYHFNKCAWCYVSQEYKSRELLLSILHDIGGINDKISEMGIDDLVEHLWRCLKGQRYLIVLDDIWDIKAWDILKGSFPDDYKGSRIVFTSRNHNLSSLAKPDCSPHLLRLFSDEESWELLQQKLFHKDGCPPTFSVIGEQIAKNCKGLPLAVAVIAGLLARTDFDINWWKHVAHSLSSRLADEGCLDILELSYKYLPDYLKPCFLYLGAFRQDKVIKVQKLSQLWIAEGFIKKSGVKCVEDVAEYLNDLISRSLIIVRDRSSKGGIKTCHLHDLLRDLCLSKVKEENFLQALDESAVSNYSSNPRMYDQYRLCIHSEWEPFMESRPTGQYVHSLLWSADYSWKEHYDVSSLFNSFKFLHVLDMVTIFLNCSFPEEITLVVHLTYLAIRGYVRYVPTTIANLWNLQTLIVKEGGYDVFIPKTIWMMKSLRHVDIRSIHSIDFSDSKLESSPLDNIVTFSSPILTCGEDTEELLRRLPRLQKLSCRFSAPNDVPYRKRFQFPMLGSLTELHSLKVTGYFFHFKKLDKIPPFNFPETLKKLTLSNFRLPWIAISRIGKLPNLEVLKLHDEAFDGKTWEVEDGEFVNLKFLKLYRLNIKQLNVPTEPFPCLQRLVVQECDRLKEIPSSIGDIPSMKVIRVYRSSYTAANSARRILEEQREMGNEGLEVHIIN